MNRQELLRIYKKRAPAYDFEAKLFNLIGFRMQKYRIEAVKALNLHPGDTVIDICCGTGLNFPLLQKKIGDRGKIIGVDQSTDMLAIAERRIKDRDWRNVELIKKDMTTYDFPVKAQGIITSFAITLIPAYDEIIRKGAESLAAGGRFVVLDFRLPDWPLWLVKLALKFLVKPFGGSLEMTERHPWESLDRYLSIVDEKKYYFGSTYYTAGEKE